MRRVTGVILFAVFALTFTLPAAAQPTPRRLAFAEVASTALQNNLQLRVALLDVAVAEAQLAQARGAKNPQVAVSGSYTRSQERPGQTLTFPNPFGPTPPEITVTLTPPDPNMLTVRLGVEFPLYTGGRLESQIALAEANLRVREGGVRADRAAGRLYCRADLPADPAGSGERDRGTTDTRAGGGEPAGGPGAGPGRRGPRVRRAAGRRRGGRSPAGARPRADRGAEFAGRTERDAESAAGHVAGTYRHA